MTGRWKMRGRMSGKHNMNATRIPGARILGMALAAGLATVSLTAVAQYPSRPVRLIVPFPAGGPADALARILSPGMSESLGQQVVIDNRVGANGNVGAEFVAHAAPDGHTLMMVVSSFATNHHLYSKLPFDPVNDFTALSLLTRAPFILVVHPSLPVRNVRELVNLARARPGELNYGAAGNGAGGHLAMELFKSMAKVDIVTVIYKGGASAITELIGGQTQLTVNNPIVLLQHVKSGRLRAIAVTSLKRLPAVPDLPTVDESGIKGFEASLWYGMVAPARLPAAIATRLNTEFIRAVQQPAMRERLTGEGVEVVGSTPQMFAEHVQNESAKWSKVIRDAKIRLE
jgi:tripartite-type tricarboxylate transporter receptor subunit TctC